MTLSKGDKAGAIAYYKKFLELAQPEAIKMSKVKEKLGKLEGANPTTSLRTDKEGIGQ
jgi:hypothetical protein